MLTIALSISNVSYKQTILSSLAKDSQIAFYQADAGAECGLYYDLAVQQFPFGTDISSTPGTIYCGDATLERDDNQSYNDYFVYRSTASDTEPCFSIVFDKVTDPLLSTIQARGNNRCGIGPRQVERAIQVQY